MFNFLNKLTKNNTPAGQELKLKISGMHCTSCSLNIDGELEELAGVTRAETSYARSETKVTFDPEQVTPQQIKKTITKLGYEVV